MAAYNLMHLHYERRGDFEGCLLFLATRLEHAEVAADDWLVASLRRLKGRILMQLGQYDRAHRSLVAASQTLEALGDLWIGLECRAWSGLLEAHMGDGESSIETLQTAVERARKSRLDSTLAWALVIRGLVDLLEGRSETLRAGLERVLEGLDLMADDDRFWKGIGYEVAAALHLALGEADAALELSAQGLRMMSLYPAPWWPERTHFTHSRILRALGWEAEADEHLQRAYDRVMLVVGHTHDQQLRRSWLENVEVNGEILAACAQRGIGSA
jgi:tetratricopeptide (TPR) repeat protein